MLSGIGIVWTTIAGNQGIELSYHEEKHAEFVLGVLKVDQYNSFENLLTHLDVRNVWCSTEYHSELVTQESQGFLFRVQIVLFVASQQQF